MAKVYMESVFLANVYDKHMMANQTEPSINLSCRVMWFAIQNSRQIGSAVLMFFWRQTDRQDKQTINI